MIDPSTAAISMNGGNSAMTTRVPNPRFCSGVSFSAGALAGRKTALSTTQTIYRPANNMPGKNAPAKRSPTDNVLGLKLPLAICAWLCALCRITARKTRMVEGGMI